jgi:antitoxin-like ribbon-helix-helix protein
MTKRPSLARSLAESVEHAARPAAPTPAPKGEGTQTEPTPSYRAATRAGKKKVTLPLDPEAHRLLRQLALDRDSTVESLLQEAVRDLFTKHGKPPIT